MNYTPVFHRRRYERCSCYWATRPRQDSVGQLETAISSHSLFQVVPNHPTPSWSDRHDAILLYHDQKARFLYETLSYH